MSIVIGKQKNSSRLFPSVSNVSRISPASRASRASQDPSEHFSVDSEYFYCSREIGSEEKESGWDMGSFGSEMNVHGNRPRHDTLDDISAIVAHLDQMKWQSITSTTNSQTDPVVLDKIEPSSSTL